MANTKLAAICLLGVLSLCAAQWSEVAGPRDAAHCTSAGQLVCNSNCSEVQLCMGNGMNGFVVETVETCLEETACFLPERACSKHSSSCSEVGFRFRCTDVGFFPDPFNCTRWYICVHSDEEPEEVGSEYLLLDEEDDDSSGFQAFHEACEVGVAYDAGRQVCTLPITSRPCVEGPVPPCATLGQDGRIPENPSIYYVCHRDNGWLFPVLYICPRGGVYNELTKQCDPV